MLSSGLQWCNLHISWHLNWRRLNVRAHEEISRIFFFLLEEVISVKYKLFFFRNMSFYFLVFWSSTERSIHRITAWSTWMLNIQCLVSNHTLKGQWKVSQYIFLFHFACKWPDHTAAILQFLNFFCLSSFFTAEGAMNMLILVQNVYLTE